MKIGHLKTIAMSNIKAPKQQKTNLNEILMDEIALLTRKLRVAGLSTQNCMIVVRANKEFFVAASGISAMDHKSALEDFSKMLRASFDSDDEAVFFLNKMVRQIKHPQLSQA